jgi:hypothetical protein
MRTVRIICTTIARMFELLILAVAGIGWARSLGWDLWGEFWLGIACTSPVPISVAVRELTPRRGPEDRE